MNWSEGYFTGVNYTYGYFKQINPLSLQLALLSAGYQHSRDNDFNYLELGFGQGVSISMHAAASDGNYWGTDFNPAHAANAADLSDVSGAVTHLFDDSFREFAARDDLPEFDYITLHGIWSWISDENRQLIVDLIKKKLKTGGVVYVSYNTYPGWAPHVPIRQLMTLFKEKAATGLDPDGTIRGAIQFAKDVFSAGANFYVDIPALTKHLGGLDTKDNNYIAHEYLNADWKLSTFAEVSTQLEEAKLTFITTTRILENFEPFRYTPEGRALLDKIGNPVLKETTKDFLTNQIFRCDVFVKGPRRIPRFDHLQQWADQLLVLSTHKSELPDQIALPYGNIQLKDQAPLDVIEVLSENDYSPKTLEQIKSHPRLAYAKVEDLIQIAMLLAGAGHVSPAQVPSDMVLDRCKKLNQHIIHRAMLVRDVEHLASPITGGAIPVPHICLLFLNAIGQGKTSMPELCDFVWAFLEVIGERMQQDGKKFESREENLVAIQQFAERFLKSILPMLKALQAI